MLIVYLSLTGNVRSFVERLGMSSVELNYANPLTEVNEPYIVIVPSYDDEITDVISEFIDYSENHEYLRGFVGSGNMNYNESFAFNAKDLSSKYNKPLLYCFELKGTDNDITELKKEVESIEIARIKQED